MGKRVGSKCEGSRVVLLIWLTVEKEDHPVRSNCKNRRKTTPFLIGLLTLYFSRTNEKPLKYFELGKK